MAIIKVRWRDLCPNLMILSRVFHQKAVLIERRLKSWSNEYYFKWNQPYLSSDLILCRGSNCLNSASG